MFPNLKSGVIANRHSASRNKGFKPLNLVFILLLGLQLLLCFVVENTQGQDHSRGITLVRSEEDGRNGRGLVEKVGEEKKVDDQDGKWYTKVISDSGVVQMGQVDLEDLPVTGLSDDQALGLLFQRYRARMMQQHEPRHFGMEDLSDREISEICGNSASLECGKKVLKHVLPTASGDKDKESDSSAVPEQSSLSVYHRCILRKEFLDCIDMQRKSCRRQAEKGVYPRLPPKSIIRSTQSKIWRALWTSGGCTLIV